MNSPSNTVETNIAGHSRRPSLGRRLVIDFLRLCQGIPLIPIERRMALGPLITARNAATPRLSWVAIFVKAWARVAERRPELRRIFVPRPFSRIFESNIPIATIVIEREWQDELVLLPARFIDPGSLALTEIHDQLQRNKNEPVESIREFRHALRFARFPWFARRILAELAINWSSNGRAHRVGTFGVSVTAGSGAGTLMVLSPCTTTLHYGLFEPDGCLPMRLTFDHRVIDGATVARAMVDFESVLLSEVLDEVHALRRAAAA